MKLSPELLRWLFAFFSNLPSDFEPTDEECAIMSRDYERGEHPWNSSAMLTERREGR